MKYPVRSFLRSSAGNVSIFFAIAIVPLLLSAGTAIDYVSANRAETQMRAALDSAAMAVAASSDASDNKRKTIGKNYFKDALKDTALADVVPDVEIVDDVVTVKARYDFPTSFMMLAGIDRMPIEVETQVSGGSDANTELVMLLADLGVTSGQVVTDFSMTGIGYYDGIVFAHLTPSIGETPMIEVGSYLFPGNAEPG